MQKRLFICRCTHLYTFHRYTKHLYLWRRCTHPHTHTHTHTAVIAQVHTQTHIHTAAVTWHRFKYSDWRVFVQWTGAHECVCSLNCSSLAQIIAIHCHTITSSGMSNLQLVANHCHTIASSRMPNLRQTADRCHTLPYEHFICNVQFTAGHRSLPHTVIRILHLECLIYDWPQIIATHCHTNTSSGMFNLRLVTDHCHTLP